MSRSCVSSACATGIGVRPPSAQYGMLAGQTAESQQPWRSPDSLAAVGSAGSGTGGRSSSVTTIGAGAAGSDSSDASSFSPTSFNVVQQLRQLVPQPQQPRPCPGDPTLPAEPDSSRNQPSPGSRWCTVQNTTPAASTVAPRMVIARIERTPGTESRCHRRYIEAAGLIAGGNGTFQSKLAAAGEPQGRALCLVGVRKLLRTSTRKGNSEHALHRSMFRRFSDNCPLDAARREGEDEGVGVAGSTLCSANPVPARR